MDKYVENLVDNSEDNCVENALKTQDQVPQWIETWSRFILNQQNNTDQTDDQSLELVQDILMAMQAGDSCISLEDRSLKGLSHHVILDTEAEHRVAPFVYDHDYIYLYRYWHLEQRLSTEIARLKSQSITAVEIDKYQHLLEDPQQKAAMKMVAEQALSIITGGPGTGKTYTLARIIAVLSQSIPDIRIAMAAPTGKAAQRMKEAMQNSFNDEKLNELGLISEQLKQQETLTIHRLLGLGHQHKPRFHAKQPLPFDVIVIDEASMLDLNLATLLLEAVADHCRIILLGDANQLASVDVGAVLADLGQVKQLDQNRVNLITSRRFKDGALIGKMAKFIQAQQETDRTQEQCLNDFENSIVQASTIQAVALTADMTDVVQLEYLPENLNDIDQYYAKLSLGFSDYFSSLKQYLQAEDTLALYPSVVEAFDRYRILCAVHHGTLGLDRLNQAMQVALLAAIPNHIQQGDWYVGRPVMMTYNDYQLGLSNGDIGICLKHRTDASQFEVYFPSLDQWINVNRLPKNIQTAFALTIHKSQGSEFKHTAVVLDANSSKLLSQELIYTAITRAKSVVTLLVNPTAFTQSLQVKTVRKSGLTEKIILKINE